MANESCNDKHQEIGSALLELASMLAGLSPEAHYEDARKILLGLMQDANDFEGTLFEAIEKAGVEK